MKQKKAQVSTIRSSAAEYLTFIAATGDSEVGRNLRRQTSTASRVNAASKLSGSGGAGGLLPIVSRWFLPKPADIGNMGGMEAMFSIER